MFGKNIRNCQFEDIEEKVAYIIPKLKGGSIITKNGSIDIGFINVNGMPTGNKNLFKY